MNHTNTQQKAQRACDTKGLHIDSNASHFASSRPVQQAQDSNPFIIRLKALYARITNAVSGCYIHRGVDMEAIATLILLAVFVTVKVFQ